MLAGLLGTVLLGIAVTGVAAAAPGSTADATGTAIAADSSAATGSTGTAARVAVPEATGTNATGSDSTGTNATGPTAGSPLVVDDAGVLTRAQEEQLVRAVERIHGYRVFVVTTPADPGPLEDDLHALGERAAWTGAGWYPDAVILALGVQSREIGTYYGDSAYDLVDPASDAIYDAMAEDFRQDDWAGGFLAGIQTVHQAILGTLPNPAADNGNAAGSDSDDTDDTGASADSSGSMPTGWLVLLIILVVGSLLWQWYRKASGGGYDDGYNGDGYNDGYDDASWTGSSWNSRRRSTWGGWSGSGSRRSGGWSGGSGGGSSRRAWGGSSRRSSGGSSRRSFGGSSRRSSGGSSRRSSGGGGRSRKF